MNEDGEKGRVLSIQSHVVHGHVGNTAASFPLQLLGYEVDALNSVQFSNHTGYKSFRGQVLESAELQELIAGLRENNLLSYTHLLTGYIGSKSFLNLVHGLLCELKKSNPDLIYVCDPVMGDCGEMYVPKELLPIYRDKLVPAAHIITPNQFEAELLSGRSITSDSESMEVLNILLSRGTKYVVITSTEYGSPDRLVLFAGSYKGERLKVEFPKFPCRFTGNGDLFSAVFLGWIREGLKVACEKTILTMQAVLKRTMEHGLVLSGGKEPSLPQLELRLVQSKRDIEDPPCSNKLITVTDLTC